MSRESVGTAPIFLTGDLFTSAERTPWAGDKISRTLKPAAASQGRTLIGESWELSGDPDFLSRCSKSGRSLEDIIREDPEAMLGQSYIESFGNQLKIIIKLVNSRMPLSFQIHPGEGYPHLKPNESPKTESWLVLAADPGSGIYMGFNRKLSQESISLLFRNGGNELKEVLQFVPVNEGDYFEIEPGTPHAIGEGVLLLEPQFVNKGFGGKTYRLWDWDRRYNSSGELDENGTGREVHLDRGLDLIDPETQWGKGYLDQIKSPGMSRLHGDVKVLEFPSNPYYQMIWLDFAKDASLDLAFQGGFVFMEVTQGEFSLGEESLLLGQPVFLPAKLERITISGRGKLAVVLPATVKCELI